MKFQSPEKKETQELNLKEIVNEAPIPKSDKEEIIGFSNYNKLSRDYVEKARAQRETNIH